MRMSKNMVWLSKLDYKSLFPNSLEKKGLLVANDLKEKTINSFERKHEMEGTLD